MRHSSFVLPRKISVHQRCLTCDWRGLTLPVAAPSAEPPAGRVQGPGSVWRGPHQVLPAPLRSAPGTNCAARALSGWPTEAEPCWAPGACCLKEGFWIGLDSLPGSTDINWVLGWTGHADVPGCAGVASARVITKICSSGGLVQVLEGERKDLEGPGGGSRHSAGCKGAVPLRSPDLVDRINWSRQ